MEGMISAAAVQMNCVLGNKEKNIEIVSSLVLKASRQGAKLVVLPELFNTGYHVEENDLELAEKIPGKTTNWMVETSRNNNLFIVGAMLERSEQKGIIYDTAVVAGPMGILGTYRKIHLWDQENVRFTKGEEFLIFDLGFARLGVQICYDIGFPEGTRILSLKGADIVVFPSAFGKERLYAWDIATRSRALENGIYVVAANRSGREKDKTTFAGASRIVDPKGNVLVEATQEDEVLVTQIDIDLVAKQRRAVPYLRDINKQLILKNY